MKIANIRCTRNPRIWPKETLPATSARSALRERAAMSFSNCTVPTLRVISISDWNSIVVGTGTWGGLGSRFSAVLWLLPSGG